MASRVNTILVVDTEVTGLDLERDVPVELGTVTLNRSARPASPPLHRAGRWQISDVWHSLVSPGHVPISFGAMGAHHITQDMVRDAPTIQQAVHEKHLLRDARVVRAAHYAAFDRVHVERHFPKTRWICTWKCASRIWPDAESKSNQALRYMLNVHVGDSVMGLDPHRAGFDAAITAGILVEMLTRHTVEDLIRISEEPMLLKECKFGKHRGSQWEDIDSGFMRWVLDRGPRREVNGEIVGFDEDTRFTCLHWLKQRGQVYNVR